MQKPTKGEKLHITKYTSKMAQDSLTRLAPDFQPLGTPEETLKVFPWKQFTQSQSTQSELAQMNLNFDPRGCFGRVALCFAMIERFFPDQLERFEYGEVTVDWFWVTLMNQWKNYYSLKSTPLPESWVTELLMYEEPHGVVVGKGAYQFEPLSVMVEGQEVWHPGAFTYAPWPAITSALIVSQAMLVQDPHEKLRLLDEAERACPNTCIVKQNRVLPLVMLNRDEEAACVLRGLIPLRPHARLFFILETLFGESHEVCYKMYGQRLWETIKNQLEKEVQQ